MGKHLFVDSTNKRYFVRVTLSFILVLALCVSILPQTNIVQKADAAVGATELMKLVYTEANATAQTDGSQNSYFPATSGEFQSGSALTAWDNGTQVLIGYDGSNRTPVVFNNGSLTGANWLSGKVESVASASAFEIKFKTTGYDNIKFSCTQKSTGSGPEAFALAYRVGSEGKFTAIEGSEKNPVTGSDNTYSALGKTYDNFVLPKDVNNQEEVYLRVFYNGEANKKKNGNTSINDIVISSGIVQEQNPSQPPQQSKPATRPALDIQSPNGVGN